MRLFILLSMVWTMNHAIVVQAACQAVVCGTMCLQAFILLSMLASRLQVVLPYYVAADVIKSAIYDKYLIGFIGRRQHRQSGTLAYALKCFACHSIKIVQSHSKLHRLSSSMSRACESFFRYDVWAWTCIFVQGMSLRLSSVSVSRLSVCNVVAP